ncbi:MAG: DUF5635 domain-containing protein [Rothia sp. (in: high G+C Gram-positive bacteria)]|uniref:DUF5635 domain-containing protein n=1 Tax=Rothia sp. (in: high G+C Gram-positive bacteria) TaxID=1885016 RepID=UPI0026DC6E21|nr:DUF5635 domain-containing protein [Rothia sp. (in: high G+C Gram-positive bacteria)]MDO4884547.1 DUF5635 domain-containing protein [Rothia sp. (in: high G+C Gram-positive bacteria)]
MILSERRQELENQVADILASYQDGQLHTARESAAIDFKEEAGRRGAGGILLPGEARNAEAAAKLADEVACFANTPGGGALILGVEDKHGTVLGTELDTEWLRQRIDEAVQVAPDIVEHHLGSSQGLRVLVLYVSQAKEPVYDTGNRLRWRVGDHCKPIDRSAWWEHHENMREYDEMAQSTRYTAEDIPRSTMNYVRSLLNADMTLTDREILRRLGALRSDGKLSQAASLVLCPASRTLLELTIFDVPAGSILNSVQPDSDLSLLEQVRHIEQALRNVNTQITLPDGFAHRTVRQVPESAVREAILNGIIHRDWNSSEPTDIRWVALDNTLIVRSPGGFYGGVTAGNVLSNRSARYPALADLFRALTMVEKQGVGVDRMYQSMMVLGHLPPIFEEVAGPHIECTLVGGTPVLPVLEVVAAIIPTARQKDVGIAIILSYLMQHPFIGLKELAERLQSSEDSAALTLRAAEQTVIESVPLVSRVKGQDAWVLGEGAFNLARHARGEDDRYVLPYLSRSPQAMDDAVRRWCTLTGGMTTGDLMELMRVSRGTAKKALDALVDEGTLRREGQGRSTRYVMVQQGR